MPTTGTPELSGSIDGAGLSTRQFQGFKLKAAHRLLLAVVVIHEDHFMGVTHMGELKSRLDTSDREEVVEDVVTLIDNEVQRKSGLTGMALKGGYRIVKKLKGGRMIEDAADNLLDPFAEALDPLYADYIDTTTYRSFDHYLSEHRKEATQALLSITDERAERADNMVLKKTYSKLRGQAEKHVDQALPATGRLIDKHAPRE
jgi:hypothetical protein